MNQPNPVSRPREFTPVLWVALLLVGLIGLRQLLGPADQPQTLAFLDALNPVVVRSSEQLHRFASLGVEVEVTEGWTYLGVVDDIQATSPTFVHKASQSIVRLEPFRLRSWPPSGANLEVETGGQLTLEWAEIDYRRVGRLRQAPVDLMILAVTPQPHAQLNREVRDFCRRIRPIR